MKHTISIWQWLFVAAMALILGACGGGGGDGGSSSQSTDAVWDQSNWDQHNWQ